MTANFVKRFYAASGFKFYSPFAKKIHPFNDQELTSVLDCSAAVFLFIAYDQKFLHNNFRFIWCG